MDSGYKIAAVFGSIVAVVALLVSTAALIGDGGGGASGEAPPAVAATEPAQPAGTQPAAQTIDVELGDLFIKPAELVVAPGADVTLRVHNGGGIDHNLAVEGGPSTPTIRPGETATLELKDLTAAEYELECTIPGHSDAGMRASLVTSSGAAPSAASTEGETHRAMTAQQMDESYMRGVTAYPAATEGQGNQPLEPRIVDDMKVFELTADEIEWEVAPGDIRAGMAYNAMIPGPLIRVSLGDRVRIVLNNRLEESTAMHFHGLMVPNDQDGVPGITQPLVKPGESFTYEFTVQNAGSHMYHSHMNGAVQIPAGLLGAFIVNEPDPPGVAGDVLMVLNDGPLGYTINGKGFPATQPIVLALGDRVRIRYMNEGLQIHPMHLHGLVQTVISRDGYPVEPHQQDTVLVAPGERIDVLVEASQRGIWAFHCHVLSHAEKEEGMFGMVTAVIIQ